MIDLQAVQEANDASRARSKFLNAFSAKSNLLISDYEFFPAFHSKFKKKLSRVFSPVFKRNIRDGFKGNAPPPPPPSGIRPPADPKVPL